MNLQQPLLQGKQKSSQLSQKTIQLLQSVEGECKLLEYQYLQVSYIKVAFLLIPLALTVIGIIFISYFKILRVKLAYCKLQDKQYLKAKYVFCKGSDHLQEICNIQKKIAKDKQNKTQVCFIFHNLRYTVKQGKPYPQSLHIEEIESLMTDSYFSNGLTSDQLEEKKQMFGENIHAVKLPSYREFMVQNLTHPFSLIIYFTASIYVLLQLLSFSTILVLSVFLTLNINFFLSRKSIAKIKQMAHHSFMVKVLRNGQILNVQSHNIFPGDIYYPQSTVPCDSIIVKGDLFVSEVGFTGQNIPIPKFAPFSLNAIMEKQHWVLEGCQIMTVNKQCLAIAVNTGFSSSKGRIIRKILHKKSSNIQFFKNIMNQSLQILFLNIIIFGVAYHYMFDDIPRQSIIYLKFADFVMSSLPSAVIVYINLLYAFSLIRINKKNIISTKSEKIVEGSRLSLICFDKTGTLTQKQTQFHEFIKLQEKGYITLPEHELASDTIVTMIMASCNSVKIIGPQVRGDEIDIAMFKKVNSQVIESQKTGIIRQIKTNTLHLQVMKINQFESKFQSMSVLVKNKNNSKYYVLSKGSPEIIQSYSITKCRQLFEITKQLSLKGLRTVAVSYKQIQADMVIQCFLWERAQFMKGCQILGLATFANEPKSESFQLFNTLKNIEINSKIITGDNIFVAVQAALNMGVTVNSQPIIALEGHNLRIDGSIKALIVRNNNDCISQEEIFISHIDQFDFRSIAIAVDSAFITQKPQFLMKHDVLIFSRASPQLKKIIVQKQKQKIAKQFSQRPFFTRVFGPMINKVGMVGDGANDLMAIKEADIGIGINNSDAMQTSDFAIQSLDYIQLLLRQCKCSEKNLVQLTLYSTIHYFLFGVINIFLVHDMSTFATPAFLWKNFTCIYPLGLLMGFFQPYQKLSKYRPSLNLLSLQNQLHFLGSFCLGALGVGIAYKYYEGTPDFFPNADRQSFNQWSRSSTILMILSTSVILSINFGVVGSSPWKQPYWKNRYIFAVVLFNLIVNSMFVLLPWFQFMGYQILDLKYAGITYVIIIGFGLFIILYNQVIRRLKLYKRNHQSF